MTIKKIAVIYLLILFSFGCEDSKGSKNKSVSNQSDSINQEQTVYHGGDIITMNGNELDLAEAVVTQNEEIVFVGNKSEALELFPEAKAHDLKGNVLLPGFVEPHVHPSIAATMLPNEIIAAYDWVLPSVTKKGVSGHEAYSTDNIHFLPKQVKLFSDGAIYSELMQMKEGYTDGHHGEWMTPLDLFQEQISMYWDNDYKIHVHSIGDKGIQQVLDFLELDQKRTPRENHRFTLHHMGYYTDDMAEEIKSSGVKSLS